LREWIDIQADIYAVSEANEPGAYGKAAAKEAAKRRVAAMRSADGD
jgi:hypothetical protein